MVEIPFKILWLIDDDDLSNFINGIILDSHPFAKSVKVFTSVQEALDALESVVQGEEDMPDIIFLDMEMPGLNGWDFLNIYGRLEEPLKEKCRLYMLSSSINEADALKAKEYGDVCEFIVKPLTTDELQRIAADEDCINPGKKDL